MLPELCDLIPQIEFVLSKEVLKTSIEINCIVSKREKKKYAQKLSPWKIPRVKVGDI